MKKSWLSVVIGILLTWAFLIVRISLAENVVYTSDDIYILGCEMITESGPKPEAAKRHKKTLEEYKQYMDKMTSENPSQRMIASAVRFPVVSWLFKDWDKYTAERGLDKAMEILSRAEKETDRLKIIEDIWEAGYQLLEFREDMIRFRRVGLIEIGFYKSTGVPYNLRSAIPMAIRNSQEKLDAFKKEASWEKAWDLCEANRKSASLLFRARSGYEDKEIKQDLENFKILVEKSHKAKKEYSETFAENSPIRKLVARFSESDERRLGIVESLQKNNMDKARYLMWRAREEAKTNKSAVLDILQAEEFKVVGKS